MSKWLATYVSMLIFMLVVDIIWLSVIAKPIYQQGIGHLMAAKPNLIFAALFYLVYVFGLLRFAIKPNRAWAGVKQTFFAGASVGLLVYASYDLTNLALLKDWPLDLALLDTAWGTVLSGITASVGKIVFDRFKGG